MKWTKVIVLIALLASANTLMVTSAKADTEGCSYATWSCIWVSPFKDEEGVRLVVGMDSSGVVRWVATPRNDQSRVVTGVISGIDLYCDWTFRGTTTDDLMVEVPYGMPAVTNGNYSLRGGFWIYSTSFESGTGNNIVVGGDHTKNLRTEGYSPFEQATTSYLVVHPNAYGDHVDALLFSGREGTTYQIVAPPLAGSQTHARDIGLLGYNSAGASSNLLCNLSGYKIRSMTGSGRPGLRYGSASLIDRSLINTPSLGNACATLYVLIMDGLIKNWL